jgi:signal transduction histidine kinase
MDAARTRRITFFVLYFVVLVAALIWVHCDYIRRRYGLNLQSAYIVFVAACLYLGLRAYLVLTRRIPDTWEYLWLAVDLVLITAGVYLTGRMGSDLALLYVWPLVTMSIQRRPRMTLCVGLGTALLYGLATGADAIETHQLPRLIARLFVIVAATAVAVSYAVTEAARVEELTRLRERLALADYRTRLSKEMHDGIQHYLVRITTRLNLAKTLLERDPRQAAQLSVDQALTVRQANDELRYLIRRLRSPVIERQGFVSALQDHVAMFGERAGAHVELQIDGSPRRLPPDVEHAAFRIIQEALTNAEKYANADQVRVRVAFGEESLECVVADNGAGFDPATLPSEPGVQGGFGVRGMQDRADSVGGRLTIEGEPGKGVTVTFRAPLTNGHEEAGVDGEDQTADR